MYLLPDSYSVLLVYKVNITYSLGGNSMNIKSLSSEGLVKLIRFIDENSSNLSNDQLNDLLDIAEAIDEDICELETIQYKLWNIAEETSQENINIDEIIEGNQDQKEKETIEKMIKAGYKFKSHVIEEEIIEEELAKEIPKCEALPTVEVEKTNDSKFKIVHYGIGIEVEYDSTTKKFNGKGARKYKDELNKRIEHYFMYEAV
jgi:hypothetical protein